MRKEFLFVGLLLCFACGVSAWGNEGHEVVAAIAASRLTPAAQKARFSRADYIFIAKLPPLCSDRER